LDDVGRRLADARTIVLLLEDRLRLARERAPRTRTEAPVGRMVGAERVG
jgi:hypothetical protein